MLKRIFLVHVVALSVHSAVGADDKAPLFINLASEGQRATMALTFGTRQLESGHPVTFFINDQAVRLVSRKFRASYGKQQEMIENLLDHGAVILVAPMFMQENGVANADLMLGVTLSSPAMGSTYLYKPGTVTLSW